MKCDCNLGAFLHFPGQVLYIQPALVLCPGTWFKCGCSTVVLRLGEEDSTLSVHPVYLGKSWRVPWLVWINLTEDFPFREDLRLEAREIQAVFHSQYIREFYHLTKPLFWLLGLLGHLAAAVRGQFLGLWSELPSYYEASLYWNIYVSTNLFIYLFSWQPWRMYEVTCPLIVELEELLPRRSPVLIQRAMGSAVPGLLYTVWEWLLLGN